ncbi:MAG: insulinase family protein [Candidatus Pedobacter colombiensis]|uniref:Insulinase family protein n=1 Tax=Candidatus Pedobacter colombiensis TaxID=3121371 RepID=A0AAJ5W7V6_9SPHI|nr:insulinase family protein [Pedobacter sp.]WEK19205.1 MAG: insulinase family protein [Pedobacter sp.]
MRITKKLFITTIALFTIQFAQAQSFTMGSPISFKLSNGMTVIVAENSGTNKIYSSFTVNEETADKNHKAGAQNILNEMLNEIASDAEAGVSFDDKGANLASLATNFDKALSIMSTSIKTPALTQPSFDKAKQNIIDHLKAQDHYYPEAVNEMALQQLTLKDVQSFYTRTITPSKAYLTIAGNITAATAKILAKKEFGTWK